MIEFSMPALGADMERGTLLEWRVRPGDAVRRGQVVAVVDTVKAAIDVECWHDGTVHALLAEPGALLPVGAPLAVLREAGESAAAVEAAWVAKTASAALQRTAGADAGPIESATARRLVPPPAAPPPVSPQLGPQGPAGAPHPRLSPYARRRAQEMRGVIAAAMSRSKREIPHYYLAQDVPLLHATAWLQQKNLSRPPAQRLLMAALLLKAVAAALTRVPGFNGYWREHRYEPAEGIHLGVAISLRAGGLVAPALHDVPALDLETVSLALVDLVRRTRAGQLRSSELADPTLTVTALGEQGVDQVFGIIHPPQVALVGFGRVAPRAWVTDDGVQAVPVVGATLSADHRATDGHQGALLLAEILEQLQDPAALDRPILPLGRSASSASAALEAAEEAHAPSSADPGRSAAPTS
ncbi:MAG: dihydrolipoamide acetyltransferase family protein [Betaproteobacteria bacterium]